MEPSLAPLKDIRLLSTPIPIPTRIPILALALTSLQPEMTWAKCHKYPEALIGTLTIVAQ